MAIKKSKTWNDYLSFTKLPAMSKADMIELLKRSVGNSERKRYTHSFHTGFDEIPDVKKHKLIKAYSKSGRRTFFKGVLYSLFLGGLPKDRDAKAVSLLLQSLLPKNSTCRVPKDDDQLCRGFAFIEIPSLEDATYLVKNGVQISNEPERMVYPRFARQKANENQV